MNLNDAFDRTFVEKFTIKPEIKNLSKEERLKLLDQLFQTEYQGKTVSYSMLEQELFVKTTAVTRAHFGIFRRKGSFKGFMTKLNIGASGDYIPLISDAKYVRSADERKPKQNKLHHNTHKWHYFAKEILCENELFRVQIDVRENKRHEFVVYNVGLYPVIPAAERINKPEIKDRRGSINSGHMATDSKDGTSSANNIPHAAQNVNRKNKKSFEVQVQAAEKQKTGHQASKGRQSAVER